MPLRSSFFVLVIAVCTSRKVQGQEEMCLPPPTPRKKLQACDDAFSLATCYFAAELSSRAFFSSVYLLTFYDHDDGFIVAPDDRPSTLTRRKEARR